MVERGRSLLGDLAEPSEHEDVRRDLEAVRAELAQLAGITSREAIESLMRRGPGRE
jgi:hypothetical protein